mmetsp:Transcript_21919/g.50610  ORF Transcript_21919/g.50610 Transcript_21919/m.50610 type:complete len:214 (-) Transcript_21919:1445-2086(-)
MHGHRIQSTRPPLSDPAGPDAPRRSRRSPKHDTVAAARANVRVTHDQKVASFRCKHPTAVLGGDPAGLDREGAARRFDCTRGAGVVCTRGLVSAERLDGQSLQHHLLSGRLKDRPPESAQHRPAHHRPADGDALPHLEPFEQGMHPIARDHGHVISNLSPSVAAATASAKFEKAVASSGEPPCVCSQAAGRSRGSEASKLSVTTAGAVAAATT